MLAAQADLPAGKRKRPELDAPPTERKTCLYSMTPDEHFLIGALPGKPVVALGGFSGHGFALSPAVGESIAGLITSGTSPIDISELSHARFDGQTVPSEVDHAG